jgi:DNA helicase-2/ATP-dependent DNA helicase PcrA
MTDLIRELEARASRNLSAQQQAAMLHGGNKFVTACPGAGKTRSISARAAVLAARGERVALTSYTNVGADEMAAVLTRTFSMSLGDEHFVGTLHGLLLRFVFKPFGHLTMRSDVAPALRLGGTEERVDVEGWEFNPDHFKFTVDGGFIFSGQRPSGCRIRNVDVARLGRSDVWQLKRLQAASGSVTTDDAMYWCYVTLRDHPVVAEAVGARFTELIVDEAQDTSALQIACLEQIVAARRLKSLFLVGDFNQSIYSFQGASPDACERLARNARLDFHRLSENHRSSQLICDVAAHLRPGEAPDRAVGPHADCDLPPKLITYAADEVSSLPQMFAETLEDRGLRIYDSAVIARGGQVVGGLIRCRLSPTKESPGISVAAGCVE